MQHLDEGTLRVLLDEPQCATEKARDHLAACAPCQTRLETVGAQAREVQSLLAVSDLPLDTARALGRIRARTVQPRMRPVGRAVVTSPPHTIPRLPITAAAVVLLAACLALTPVGSWAQSVVTIFQPQSVAAVPITMSELQSLPNLGKFGTLTTHSGGAAMRVTSAAAASSATGMQVLTPTYLPPDTPLTSRIGVTTGTTATFTFSASRAQTEAQKEGKTLPPMPASIDGSTLTLTIKPAVVAVYGSGSGIPALVVGQVPAPTVTSSGLSVRQLEGYLIQIDPTLKPTIDSLVDPTSTLPIPIPLNFAAGQSVTVQGVKGVAVGDSTGIGSAVVWVKDGIVYAVGGTSTLANILHVADSLH